MNKPLITFLTGVTLLLGGCAQYQPNPVITTNQTELPKLANVSYASLLSLPYTDNSLKLQYGESTLQYGRLYLPQTAHIQTTSQTKAPLVVFIHGGCWLNAYDISHSRAFSQAVAAQGFAVWSLEYRRIGDEGGGWPGSLHDVLQGLSFVKNGLNGFVVDNTNIVIAGHSAGGQLALLAGGHSYVQPQATALPAVKAVVGLAAITDMFAYASGDNSCQRATNQFMGGSPTEQPARYQQANPQQQRLHPATLLLHGSEDSIVPLTQASASGLSFKTITNAGHFDWIHPHTLAYKQFIETLQELFAQ
ncbi:alpha/beta hydrolase fold [Arsukibacterium tuosuense]|uniref:Alpha/beta hydrolase fold n=1 Tax=Arsukibacterium tuosuense TaxID=1323745 RepID=A0A285I101_9GAMM|nr:alpha/beta hydrolase [Arsukibacterium tuosuense]SNY41662.1 alpha/beta hydrolase fold [Arsukibacterium tuosuense]